MRPAGKNEAAVIPDATHKPVFTTNSVTISGQRVTYVAETGMLPILAPTGSVRASVFYVAYTRESQDQPRRTAGHVLFQWRSWLVIRLAASRRTRPAPGEAE